MESIDHIVEQLSALGEVSSRPLFGGYGVYWRKTIFAILYGGKLYLKVDDQSKGALESRGMGPFRPNERQALKSYYVLGLVGKHRCSLLLDHVLATASFHPVPVQGLYLPDVPLEAIRQVSHHLLRSDHTPFWREGLPAWMWTDTAEFRNPEIDRAGFFGMDEARRKATPGRSP